MLSRRFLFLLIAGTAALSARAIDYRVRAGYNIGGTLPFSMPAEIRKLNSYHPRKGFTLGADLHCYLDDRRRWGFQTGVKLQSVQMKTDARVKNYRTRITMERETIEGYFTGNVVTEVNLFGVSLPFYATLDLDRRWRLRAGCYATFAINGRFGGAVYDGYLRRNAPTGEKVEIGGDTRATYNFDDDLAKLGVGLSLGADCLLTKRWGVYAELNCGLTDIFRPSFETITVKMNAVYGTIGVVYHLNL